MKTMQATPGSLRWTGVRAAMLSILLGVMLAALAPAKLSAQSAGTISGTVRDESSAVLPGVEVVMRNVETGFTRTVATDAAGRYSAPQLPLGQYEVRASFTGFKTEVRSGLTLTVGREAVVELILKVGSVAETVEVTGEAPLVETTNSAVAGLVSDQQVRDLPLNGRSIEQLAILQLGVTLSRNGNTGMFSGSVTRINIGGARTTSNSFLLDGTDINDIWNNTPGSVAGVSLGVDTIREFKVLVNNYSAEYGRAGGGVVLSVTRSGTNELHGSAFEFLRNSALDARNFFDRDSLFPSKVTDPPPFRRNQFGFTLGGPIKTDKTFFFGSFEGLRQNLTTTQFSRVPSARIRAFAHPTVAPYLALLPLPAPNAPEGADGTVEYVGQVREPIDENYMMVRADHSFSSSDSLFGRYTFDNANKFTPNIPNTLALADRSRNQYLTIEENHIFSPAWLAVFRAGYNRSVSEEACPRQVEIPSSLDLIPGRPFASSGGITPGSGIVGLSNCGTSPQGNWYNLLEGSTDMTFIRSGHSLKTGVIGKNIRVNKRGEANQSGSYTFTSLFNFLGISNLAGTPLANGPTSSLFTGQLPLDANTSRSWRQELIGTYIQDEWKATSKLTLNLGLRYEVVTAPSEAFGRGSSLLNPQADRNVKVFGKEPFLPNLSKKNFAPRIGFAYDPTGSGRTVIRGGGGIFYDQILPATYQIAVLRNPPFYVRASITNPPWPNAYQLLLAGVDPGSQALNNFTPSSSPRTMQYNFGVQHQFAGGWVANMLYLGSRGMHLISARDANSALPQIQQDGRYFFPLNAVRRNPNFGEIVNYTTDGNSNYNSLGLGINKRFSQGFQLQGSYNWSKLIDNTSGQYAPETASGSRSLMNPDDPRVDRSLSAQNVGQNLVGNVTYELPLGAGASGIAAQLIHGWQLNSIVTLSSGVPVNLELGFNRARNAQVTGTGFQQRPDLVSGSSNNPTDGASIGCAGGFAAGTPLGTPDLYVDPCAFRLPEAGYFGNLGRNTIIGPPLTNVDFSVLKRFELPREGLSLQWRTEVFNLFNHANFFSPNRTIFSTADGVARSDFGQIRSTRTSARQIQFGLKLLF
ncbi:MAG: hypothetical protein EXQ56_02055 [Acidobacteria bacterium]|nr:hypothetical protein [Acidobacteriota bacterium]